MNRRERANSGSWMTTYGDLMSLLLVLFVFLFTLGSFAPPQKLTLETGRDNFGHPVLLEVHFTPASDELTERVREKLKELTSRLGPGQTRLLVVGFASPFQSSPLLEERQPETLSLSRARKVAAYLRNRLRKRSPLLLIGGLGVHEVSRGVSPPAVGVSPSTPFSPPGMDYRDRVDVCLITTLPDEAQGEGG